MHNFETRLGKTHDILGVFFASVLVAKLPV